VTRSARTGTSPTSIARQLMYGNASLRRSALVQPPSTSRARGPQSARQAHCDVTSSTRTSAEPAAGRWERIQARSWLPKAVPVTIPNRSSSSRVTVKSHSIPPRRLSICV
jgi:hypothetical protein